MAWLAGVARLAADSRVARRQPRRRAAALGKILAQDRHLEHERAVLVLVLIDDAHELLADVDLAGVLLPRPRLQPDARIGESPAQMALDLADHSFVHAQRS